MDTISTPTGKRDRPFANPGILRGFLSVALCARLLKQDIHPVGAGQPCGTEDLGGFSFHKRPLKYRPLVAVSQFLILSK